MTFINFKFDHDNIVDDIKSSVTGEPTLIIFDDLIGSSSLKEIANLFTVDARHMNMSLVFLTQRMFVNDESFRQISQNCDYFVLFKNPRNSSERHLEKSEEMVISKVSFPVVINQTTH